MIIPIGDVTEAPVLVEKGIIVIMNLFALYCENDIWVTMLLNLILIVGMERS
jgi:hypothetical protein